MEQRQRLKRPEPERIEPIRNWSMMYRRAEPPEAPGDAGPADPAAPRRDGGFGDAVANAVKLAYRVADDNIRLGQRVAQQINDRAYDLGAMRGDLREITERTVRGWMDLGALWLEALGSLTGAARPAGRSSAETTKTQGGAGVSLDVASAQPVKVTLDLQPQAQGLALTVGDLRAPNSSCPPLGDVGLEAAKDGRGVHLRVRVSPGQPAGLYSGCVVDASGRVHGILTVRVGELPAEFS